MKYAIFTLLAITSALLLAGAAVAQESETAEQPPAQQEGQNPAVDLDVQGTMSVEGKVINASPEEIIVQTEDGREVFLLESEDLHAEPIEDGANVKVWYVERADKYYATRLDVTGGGLETAATLPQTASPLPLLALLGLASLGGATVLRRRRG